jgi:hypothetical protein
LMLSSNVFFHDANAGGGLGRRGPERYMPRLLRRVRAQAIIRLASIHFYGQPDTSRETGWVIEWLGSTVDSRS